jgi:hypothetical protein
LLQNVPVGKPREGIVGGQVGEPLLGAPGALRVLQGVQGQGDFVGKPSQELTVSSSKKPGAAAYRERALTTRGPDLRRRAAEER